jgi:hypothetical protein
MKITKSQLRRIINEEFDELDEGGLLNKLLNRDNDNDIVDRQPPDQYSSEHDSYRNVQDELTRLAQAAGKDPYTFLQSIGFSDGASEDLLDWIITGKRDSPFLREDEDDNRLDDG